MKKYLAHDLNGNLLIAAAKRRGYRVELIYPDFDIFAVSKGRQRELFAPQNVRLASPLAKRLCKYKPLTNRILKKAGLKVPRLKTARANNWAEIKKAARQVGYPVVIKPFAESCGFNVFTNLNNDRELRIATNQFKREHSEMLIESFLTGYDIRLLGVGGRLVAATARQAPVLTGDGRHTVSQLIARENRKRQKNTLIPAIEITDTAKYALKRQHLTLRSVLKHGREVKLRDTANLHAGGTAVDITAAVHQAYHAILKNAYQALAQPTVMGMDIITPDYESDPRRVGYRIIEVNSYPGIKAHHFPSQGTKKDAAGAILDYIFRAGPWRRIKKPR